MKIRLIGQRNILGGGVHYANFADALKRLFFIGSLVEEVDSTDMKALHEASVRSAADDITIHFHQVRQGPYRGLNICWTMFECTVLPAHYVAPLIACDLVWAPSQWAAQVLSDNGVPADRIDVVPLGVDPHLYHPHLRSWLKRTGPFRFLAVGKFEKRKSYEELLQAFAETFGASADTELVIKGDYFINDTAKKLEFTSLVESFNLPNIKLKWGQWSQDSMVGLYNFCDALVYPSKAEGWGLPLIEAIGTGLPVAATCYSGHSEFLEAIRGSFTEIEYVLRDIDDPEFRRFWPPVNGTNGHWAVPEISSLASAMTRLKGASAEIRAAALDASQVIRSQYSWDNSANVALRSLAARDLIPARLEINVG